MEAASAGLRVITHGLPDLRWLVPDTEDHVDMARPGALAERLRELRHDGTEPQMPAERAASARARFDWWNLRSRYVELYERAMAVPLLREAPLPRVAGATATAHPVAVPGRPGSAP